MGSKACYAVSKATAGRIRNSGGAFHATEDGTLLMDDSGLNFVKWIGTTYIVILLAMLGSWLLGWMIPFYIGLALFGLTYAAAAFLIVTYVCLSEHEDDPADRYTWKTGWTVFKRINTIMYLGITLWFKTELKMM